MLGHQHRTTRAQRHHRLHPLVSAQLVRCEGGGGRHEAEVAVAAVEAVVEERRHVEVDENADLARLPGEDLGGGDWDELAGAG